ncbi:hypothetical protein COB11_03140 [Candidatus Aerophobetes bacterium]|uniref:NAD-dependent epimerase/dehydratase domain-containing protein n=1 Tax=Aerophobetes bacterium TaxID=2030807 RepID=A0A2A4YJU5_UNCAE|nr:MAG: hypothetical protein COB11_03140 [Candidatus Aerophobetes bacterium]
MRYLITGATGFIGSHVVDVILEEPDSLIVALVKKSSDTWRLPLRSSRFILVETDFYHVSTTKQQLENYSLKNCIHLAWQGVERKYRNDLIQISNQNITSFILNLSKELNINRFIGIGSQAEYGIKKKAIQETDSLDPFTLYGDEKVKASLLVEKFCKKNCMEYIWLRIFSSYGPKDNNNWLIPYVIGELLINREPKLTNGLQKWDYMYVKDVARAILSVAQSSKTGIFNLGSGFSITIQEVVNTIYRFLRPNKKPNFDSLKTNIESYNLEPDMNLFRTHFGLQDTYDFNQGIKETIDFMKKQHV